MKLFPHKWAVWALCALLCFANCVSWAAGPVVPKAKPVSPSQVTPKTLAPQPAESSGSSIVFSSPETPTPTNASSLSFHVRNIVVNNSLPEIAETIQKLILSQENREITVAQLYALAQVIEGLYSARGYVLVRVSVPPQALQDQGDAHLEVTDGFIEKIDLKGVPSKSRDIVWKRVKPLLNQKKLKYADLDRAVTLAGDIAGIKLRSALSRGNQNGGAILVLEGQEQPVSLLVSTDNNLPASLGGTEWTARISVNNALGHGETPYFSYTSGYDMGLNGFPMSPLRGIEVGVVTPLGGDGFVLTPSATRSVTHTQGSPGTPTKKGKKSTAALGVPISLGIMDRLSLNAAFPVLRGHDQSLLLTTSLEYTDQKSIAPTLNNTYLNHDSYLAARANANWQGPFLLGGTSDVDSKVSQGLGRRTPTIAEPISRAGASPSFTTLNGVAHANVPLAFGYTFDTTARGQWSFKVPQLTSEEFSLEDAKGISAYSSGSLNVDAGGTLRTELSKPFTLPWDVNISPYVFGAEGYGLTYQATKAEHARISAEAFGIGTRIAHSSQEGYGDETLNLELAHGISSAPNEGTTYRFGFNFSYTY